jgi:chromate reductase, NAD(P)H dehydrogenase (quinone)
MSKPKILIVNGSRLGSKGNTNKLLSFAKKLLDKKAVVSIIVLRDTPKETVLKKIKASDGLLIGTGTHWDSWSKYLQAFLEYATGSETTKTWLGKPAAVLISEHSVGGKGVLSRLQGVLVTYGCMIPPLSGMVYSLVGQKTTLVGGKGADDVWAYEDVKIICHNLVEAVTASKQAEWCKWEVGKGNYEEVWVRCRR